MIASEQAKPEPREFPQARNSMFVNPFFTAETDDREHMARRMLEALEQPEER